jgi:carbon monoxide dehydrogenase subunit G
MATTHRSIHVEASASRVWDYLLTPESILEWWPGCVEIHSVAREGDGGYAVEWTNRPAGVMCRGEMVAACRPEGEGLAITLRVSGDLYGDMSWEVQGEGSGTRLTFRSDYDMPVRALIPYLSPYRILMYQQDEADAIIRSAASRLSGNGDGNARA